MEKDLYSVLGLSKGASDDDIKRAFKKLSVKYHPDRNPGNKEAEEKFKEINAAYQVLSDPEKKQQYDTFGTIDGAGMDPGFADVFARFGNMFRGFGDFGFGGFGGHQPRQQQSSKADRIVVEIPIGIDEVINGVKKTVKFTYNKKCHHCNGAGGEGVEICPDCHGTGYVTHTQRTPFGITQTTRPCGKCHGQGKIVKNTCHVCHGTGYEKAEKEIAVKFNPGVQDGQAMIYNGYGNEGRTKYEENGDVITVARYNFDTNKYAIDGTTVYELLHVPYYDCILGCEMSMKPAGSSSSVKIKVPQYSSDGTRIQVYGKGIDKGMYIYIVKPKFPGSISSKEKDLLIDIKKMHN